MRGLDFILAGAQKCATSWLYYCLREHPEIALPDRKQEEAYLGSDLWLDHGPFWIPAATSEPQVIGDASVEYLFQDSAVRAVREHSPDTRVLVMVRNPVRRLISAHAWLLRRGLIAEESVDVSIERALADHEHGRPTVHAELILRGLYGPQIQRYADFIPPDRMFIGFVEVVERDPMAVVRAIYSFLGVDPEFRPSHLNRAAKRSSFLPGLTRIERLAPGSRILAKGLDLANQAAHRLGMTGRTPEPEPRLVAKLQLVFRESVQQLERLVASLPDRHRPAATTALESWHGYDPEPQS